MTKLTKALCAYITHPRRFRVEKSPNVHLPDDFEPFLRVRRKDGKRAYAMLYVRFEVRHLSFWQRKVLPAMSIPFCAGMPGFVSKVYGLKKDQKEFMGQYEWQSDADAKSYIESAGRFMKNNAVTLHYEIKEIAI